MAEEILTPKEKKRLVLEGLKLANHPLADILRESVGRLNPEGVIGQRIINEVYENYDRHLSQIPPEEVHPIHELVARWAPHRLGDAHRIVKEIKKGALRDHREHVERLTGEVAKAAMRTSSSAAANKMVETTLELLLKARSDPELRKRLGKIAKIFKTAPNKVEVSKLMEHTINGPYKHIRYPLIDALAEKKHPDKLKAAIHNLVRIGNHMRNTIPERDWKKALRETISVRSIERKPVQDVIIESTENPAIRNELYRWLKRRGRGGRRR